MKRSKQLLIITFFITFLIRNSYGLEPPTSLKMTIPDYTVIKVGEIDYIEIPDGAILLLEEGRPKVPYYIKTIDYPKGYRIQDVILKERSGMKMATGLKLPVVIFNWEHKAPISMKQDLYPEKEYEWRVLHNQDGSTTLVITLYPFYYDPRTTDVKFYKNYHLDIKYVKTTISLIRLTTDKHFYDPAANVKIKVELKNSGKPQDIIIAGTIKREFTDETIAELPLKALKNVPSADSTTLEWQTKGFPNGDYYVEVKIKDNAGNSLDLGIERFGLGIPAGEITSFKVTPEHFKIGDKIQILLDYQNTGSCELSGNCIFEIKEAGKVVWVFSDTFVKLLPGKSRHFSTAWHTKETKKGVLYYVLGYVSCGGTATLPKVVMVSTNLLPTAKFTYLPEKPIVDKEVFFDASGSTDNDGNITEYQWNFGDGGIGSGKKVSHIYSFPGDYEITLTIKDNEGATAEMKQTLTMEK